MVAISELRPVDAGGASAVAVLPLECVGGTVVFLALPPGRRGGGYLRFRYCPVLGVTISEVRGSRR